MKLTLCLSDTWTTNGAMSVPRLLAQAGEPVDNYRAFFERDDIRDKYREFVRSVVGRYAGREAIMSWNLINEPRCKGCGTDVIDKWVGEMASFQKSVDGTHLVTVGEVRCHSSPATD